MMMMMTNNNNNNKYVGFSYYRVEMYAGRVACYTLVSHGE